jgi:hypothetical protein
MIYENACNLLNIDKNEKITTDLLKKHYRMKALQYHPDKNHSPDASLRFSEIQNAYEYLAKFIYEEELDDIFNDECDGDILNKNYVSILETFLTNVLGKDLQFENIKGRLFNIIVTQITNRCEDKAIEMLMKLDKKKILKIYELFFKYRDVFHFSEGFLKKLQELIATKIQNDECIILNPLLEDLFENNLYKLNEYENTYYIPLWHHELTYDNSGGELYVKCIPILPENVFVDDNNNIHVYLRYDIQTIWKNETIEFDVCGKTFSFKNDQVKFKKKQMIFIYGKGISCINTADIYDVSNKSDICVNLELFFENV